MTDCGRDQNLLSPAGWKFICDVMDLFLVLCFSLPSPLSPLHHGPSTGSLVVESYSNPLEVSTIRQFVRNRLVCVGQTASASSVLAHFRANPVATRIIGWIASGVVGQPLVAPQIEKEVVSAAIVLRAAGTRPRACFRVAEDGGSSKLLKEKQKKKRETID